jgi:hypothetical protein
VRFIPFLLVGGCSVRVTLLVDLADASEIERGVALRGLDAGVAKHLLERTQVGSVANQVGGVGVPEHVGRDPFLDPCRLGVLIEGVSDPVVVQPTTLAVEEQERGVGVTIGEGRPGLDYLVDDLGLVRRPSNRLATRPARDDVLRLGERSVRHSNEVTARLHEVVDERLRHPTCADDRNFLHAAPPVLSLEGPDRPRTPGIRS